MIKFFERRDFPPVILQKAAQKARSLTQDEALRKQNLPEENSSRIPFVSRYHPAIHKVHKVLTENWKILKDDPEMGYLFPSLPLLSLRKGKSLKDILVHSTLEKSVEIGGTFPCNRRRCNTCSHTNNTTNITGPNGSYTIRSSFNCTTKNVVYAISCLCCGMIYIGETLRRLGDRFREHLRDIRNNTRTSPVAQHFHRPGHSIEDVTVGVLLQCSSDQHRKETEMRLIQKLGTLDPQGMNLDFNYNV